MEVALMIEGQDGVNWSRWKTLAQAAEDLGFVGLYRSDHFTNSGAPDKDSLELWVSLTWLASHTTRIEFGPMVTPVSFRNAVFTARMARDVDDLSGGRLTLGLGAGWQDREHDHFGFDLLDVEGRFARFREALDVITKLLNSDEPVDYDGEYYKLQEAILLPRPARAGGPPILIGGNGPKRTLPLVAEYATEWNAIYKTPDQFAALNAKLNELLNERNRDPGEVRRSMMTGIKFGRDENELKSKLGERSAQEWRDLGVLVGNATEIVEHLGQLAQIGLQRIMLQWLDLDDMDGLEIMANSIIPQL